MNIKIKTNHSIWNEKHDIVNIKLIFMVLLMVSVFLANLRVGNKVFFRPQFYFSKSLRQNIFKEKLNVTTDNFAKQEKYTFSGRHLSNYADLKIPQLIEKLSDATPVRQRLSVFSLSTHGVEAANYLAKLGSQAIEPLTTALNDPRPAVRGNAVLALGLIKNNLDIKSIVALFEDKNPIVRMKTAMALTLIDNPQARDALINALNDEEEEVRAEAVKALSWRDNYQVKKALRAALDDQSWLVRSEIKAALQ
ncbi:MAG: HEAT repeat domain-containing protein [Candidatus Omnitrophota bacterium]